MANPKLTLHPAQRFVAPSSIQRGVPLKNLLDATLIGLLADSITPHHQTFNRRRFRSSALKGLDDLGLMPRSVHIASAIAHELPSEPSRAADLLIAAMGPELSATTGLGLAPFFYLPHSAFIRSYLINDFDAGMRANLALTKRFSA